MNNDESQVEEDAGCVGVVEGEETTGCKDDGKKEMPGSTVISGKAISYQSSLCLGVFVVVLFQKFLTRSNWPPAVRGLAELRALNAQHSP